MKQIQLIAGGYEWICPYCDTLNTEIEVTQNVTCSKCKKTYEVEDYQHAIG